jgi:NAD(P)-dependent dehydrogenase (short-subunit alcohol dehydrogenase family)
MENNMQEKTYVVTGATSGIGYATAEHLVDIGAFVIGIGRSEERCWKAKEKMMTGNPEGQIVMCVADLSLQSNIRGLRSEIETILRDYGRQGLDGLVNNAGTFTYWQTLTAEGFEMQWALNYLAPFLLSNVLLPLLMEAPKARIVTVSSDSHYQGRMKWSDLQLSKCYNGLAVYCNTKLGNVLFTQAFNYHIGPQASVRAFAADPGLVKTEIGFKDTPTIVRWIWNMRRSGGTSPDVPANNVVYLLTEPGLEKAQNVYWKNCQPKRASRRAMDMQDALRLWDESEKMCGLA